MFALYGLLFRLVEEEEISSEVKAEFKEKTKVIQHLLSPKWLSHNILS